MHFLTKRRSQTWAGATVRARRDERPEDGLATAFGDPEIRQRRAETHSLQVPALAFATEPGAEVRRWHDGNGTDGDGSADERHPIFTEASKAHVEMLAQGVDVWNRWREANPDVRPELRGIDFRHACWDDTALERKHGRLVLVGIRLEGADCYGAHFEGAYCHGAHFEGAYCGRAYFGNLSKDEYREVLVESFHRRYKETDEALEKRKAEAIHAQVASVWPRIERRAGRAANLSGASFAPLNEVHGQFKTEEDKQGIEAAVVPVAGNVNLRSERKTASLSSADLTGADLRSTDLTGTDLTGVQYDPQKLGGKCLGIQATECFGSPLFKRDVLDQDYLDALAAQNRSHRAKPRDVLKNLAFGLGFGVLLASLAVGDPFALLAGPTAPFDPDTWRAGLALLLPTLIATGLSFSFGRRALFWLWSLTDYGRDFDRVLLFAFFFVLLFGTGYALGEGTDVTILCDDAVGVWYYPWFVALMGFATLGVSDLAEPLTPWGAMLMMGNVLSGFLTLGLLLSVLADKFARRA